MVGPSQKRGRMDTVGIRRDECHYDSAVGWLAQGAIVRNTPRRN